MYPNRQYQPVQFQQYSNSAFWGTLLDAQWMPSELLCRISDALFFYIDANAQSSYPNTGYIEPDKYMWFSTFMDPGQQDKEASDFVVKTAMFSLYDSGHIPYTIVTTMNGEQLPILDRRAFLHSLVSTGKVEPPKFVQMLNKAITTFNLVDPGTRQPFAPYVPIPLNAVPQQPDWASWQASEQWKAQLITRYTGFRQQQLQKRAQRNQMIGGAVKLAGSALGNFVGTH